MNSELLHVITTRFNPIRYQKPDEHFLAFEKHMLDSGVCLHVVELQTGDRPFSATETSLQWPAGRYSMTQLRSRDIFWAKENMINIGVSRLPADWKYVAWIDSDVTFRRDDWAAETVHKLQIYDVVQPWSHAELHGPLGHHQHADFQKSFVSRYFEMLQDELAGKQPHKIPHGKHPYGGWWGHCGYGWAMRRSAWNKLGGLLDICILGSGDHHMACALVGHVMTSLPQDMSPQFKNQLQIWQDRAEAHVQRNIGFVHGTIDHAWHGSSKNRKYVERWQILKRNNFNPDTDLKRDWQGLWQLTGNKPRLRDDIRLYMSQRNEDSNTLE